MENKKRFNKKYLATIIPIVLFLMVFIVLLLLVNFTSLFKKESEVINEVDTNPVGEALQLPEGAENIALEEIEGASVFSDKLAPVKYNEKWGYINENGEIVVDFIYENAEVFSNGLAAVAYEKINTMYSGYINRSGKLITEKRYDYPLDEYSIECSEDLYEVKLYNNFGCINIKGEEVLETKYNSISIIYPAAKLMFATTDENAFVINNKGEKLLTTNKEIKNFYSFENEENITIGYLGVTEEGNYLFDKDFNKINDELYENVEYSYEDRYVVKAKDKTLLINTSGELIKDITELNLSLKTQTDCMCEIYYGFHFYGNASMIFDGSKYGLIDINGNILVGAKYDSLEMINNTLYLAEKDSKYGVINTSGEEIIEFKYDDLRKDGICEDYINCELLGDKTLIAQNNNKYGVISLTGEELIPFEYDYLFYEHKYVETEKQNEFELIGYAVEQDSKYGLIDLNNEIVINAVYEWSKTPYFSIENQTPFQYLGEFIIVKQNNKYGVINREEEIIIPMEYEYILGEDSLEYNNNPKYFITRNNSLYEIYDLNYRKFIDGGYKNITLYKNMIAFEKDNKYSIYDYDGNNILPESDYDYFYYENDSDVILVEKNNLYTFYKRGEPLKIHYVE